MRLVRGLGQRQMKTKDRTTWKLPVFMYGMEYEVRGTKMKEKKSWNLKAAVPKRNLKKKKKKQLEAKAKKVS